MCLFPIIPIIPKGLSNLDTYPPKLYDIMESIVNYDKEDKTKIKDLSKIARETIFNFNYPLSQKIIKEDFECMILNHFIMRRIGFQTLTAFRIQLDVKLNEIMPNYNKMFDMLVDWNIFEDGEKITHSSENKQTNHTETEGENSTRTSANTSNIVDNRNSDTPQDDLQNVRDGKYIDKYSYNTSNSEDSSENEGFSSGSSDSENNTKINETTIKTQSNKLQLYNEFIEKRKNIYSMIFEDLEDLFFQIVD